MPRRCCALATSTSGWARGCVASSVQPPALLRIVLVGASGGPAAEGATSRTCSVGRGVTLARLLAPVMRVRLSASKLALLAGR